MLFLGSMQLIEEKEQASLTRSISSVQEIRQKKKIVQKILFLIISTDCGRNALEENAKTIHSEEEQEQEQEEQEEQAEGKEVISTP